MAHTPLDLMATVKSRTRASRVLTILPFEFFLLRVSETLISHHMSLLMDGSDDVEILRPTISKSQLPP
jgi:hypothetical protein